jgi:hypothetical protein
VGDERGKARIAPVDEARLLRAAACDGRLSRGDVGVFAVILEHADDTWVAFPGIRLLSERARLAASNVLASISKLEGFGYITVLRRGQGRRQDYRVMASPEIVETAPVRRNSGFTPIRSCGHEQLEAASVPVRENSLRSPTVPVGRLETVPADRMKLFVPTGTESTSESTSEITEAESTRTKSGAKVKLPAWLPADAWQEWKAYRGSKFSSRAQAMAIRKLDELRASGHDPTKLIHLAIASSWSSFYERESTKFGKGKSAGTVERDPRSEAEIERANAEQLARFGLKDAA